MLPPDDFLRKLPVCLAPVQRLRFETLVFAHDIMEIGLSHLHHTALAYDPEDRSDLDRIALFSDSWAIVDQVHVVRQILLSLTSETRGADTQAFIDEFASAHRMRNCMDHLNQNLPNRAKASGITNPMFGFLSFFRPDPARFEDGVRTGEIRGELIYVTGGSAPAAMAGGMAWHEMDIRLPVCSFKLQAFDEQLLLERAVTMLRPLLRRLSDDLFANISAQAMAHAESTGDSLADLMAPAAGYMAIQMDFAFRTA